ncbi:unnamed protein product [Effrenium voratum]|nr:unnamed protein product [Effrenium voratum]
MGPCCSSAVYEAEQLPKAPLGEECLLEWPGSEAEKVSTEASTLLSECEEARLGALTVGSCGSIASMSSMARSSTRMTVAFQEEQIIRLFQKFDANGDNCVSQEELLSVLQQLSDPSDTRGERLEELLHGIDTNGDGFIQLEEFMAWCYASGDMGKRLRWTCVVQAEQPLMSRKRLPPRNTNRISQFRWLEDLLRMIVEGKNQGGSGIRETGERATPLFAVAGVCPNTLCDMQAMLFCQVSGGVDFWWVKPQADDPTKLETQTLDLHKEGAHRNYASKSKALYQPLSDMFSGSKDGAFEFGVDESGRAFIQETIERSGRCRMLLFLVWQENWSSCFAYNKFIEGKLFYQHGEPWDLPQATACGKTPPAAPFFARQFRLEGGGLKLAGLETEETVLTLMPPDVCQEMFPL